MSSYFIRHCSGFSLIMTFRCHVSAGLSGCCGKNDFVCNHWERKGMSTDVYFCGYCNMGPVFSCSRVNG